MTVPAPTVDRALALARRVLNLSSLALRPAGAATLPPPRNGLLADGGYELAVPIRIGGAVRILTAGSERPFDSRLGETLVEIGGLLAEFAADEPPAGHQAVLDLEADHAQIAAELDTVAATLVVVKHVVADTALVDAVDAALNQVRRTQRRLRAEALDAGVVAALRRLGVTITGDLDVLAALPPSLAVVVQRVAETLYRPDGHEPDERGQIAVDATRLAVKFHRESAENVGDATELDRWVRRVSALGGELIVRADSVVLRLPVPRGDERR